MRITIRVRALDDQADQASMMIRPLHRTRRGFGKVVKDSTSRVQMDHGYIFRGVVRIQLKRTHNVSSPPTFTFGFVAYVWPMTGVGLYGSSRCLISSSVNLRSSASENRVLSKTLHCTRQWRRKSGLTEQVFQFIH